jgi:pimeloyl-ACP methyl ester carboxylesterase
LRQPLFLDIYNPSYYAFVKKLKQIIAQVKADITRTPDEFNDLLWQLICYPPKMSLRLQQEQLLNEAEKFTLEVKDDYFANSTLLFNGFKWGNGHHKLLITHGWGSKAADFMEIITALKEVDDLQIIAFDAPGNGSSEGELSNLLLYIQAVKEIVINFGKPDIVIGHSLGAMANIIALAELNITTSLLISIAPLIRLKENFEASMSAVEVPDAAQDNFLKSFEEKFHKPAAHYNLIDLYSPGSQLTHWVAYDQNDQVSAYRYLEEFLNSHTSVNSQNYDEVGHERIIKFPKVINDLVNKVKVNLH